VEISTSSRFPEQIDPEEQVHDDISARHLNTMRPTPNFRSLAPEKVPLSVPYTLSDDNAGQYGETVR
jgi:hypothetical protein